MLEPIFVMLFSLPGKMDGSIHRKRTAGGETTGSGMAIPLRFCQEGDIIQIGYTHPTWIFVAQSLAPISIYYVGYSAPSYTFW
jgi:hypothetical protein